jgi:hypothetical protein
MKGDAQDRVVAEASGKADESPRLRTGRVVWGFVGITVLVVALAGYYYAHKPVSPGNAEALARVVADTGLALLIVFAGGALGRRLIPQAHPQPLAAMSFQAALGLGLMGLGVLLMGAVGGLHRWVFYGLLLALILGFRRSGWAWVQQAEQALVALRRAAWPWRAAALAGVMLVTLAWFEAAAPPARYDALLYHLDLPARFLGQGSIRLTPDNQLWGMPLLGEMLYTLAMGLGRAQTAALLGWAAAVLTLLGVAGLGSGWGRRVGWIAPLVLLGGSTLASTPGWAYVDWWAALFGLGLLIAVDRYRTTQAQQAVLLAGVLAGLTCGVKYTAWIALPAGCVAVWLVGRNRTSTKNALMFLVVGLAVASPWLVKNYIGTGVPVFPYFGVSPAIEPLRQQAFQGAIAPPPVLESLLIPVAATFAGHEHAPGFSADIGPLLLGLLPGLALVRRQSREALLPAGGFLIVGWIAWGLAIRFSGLLIQTRLYFVLMPAWALLAGAGFSGWSGVRLRGVRLERLAAAAVAVVVVMLLVQQFRQWIAWNPAAVLMGEESRSAYLTRRLGATQLAMESMDRLPPENRVIMLWEPRSLYCLPRCVPDVWIDRWLVDLRQHKSGEAVLEAWKRAGATHVLLHVAGMEFTRDLDPRYTAADWDVLDTLLQSLERVETIGEGYVLYRVP